MTQIVGAAAKIARAAEDVAEIKQTTAKAEKFTSDTKDATGELQAAAGKQIAGLREGRRELEKAVAALASRADGLKSREDALGAAIGDLRTLRQSGEEKVKAAEKGLATSAQPLESLQAEIGSGEHANKRIIISTGVEGAPITGVPSSPGTRTVTGTTLSPPSRTA